MQDVLFPELDDTPLLVKELRDVGLSAHDALEIWQHVGAGRVEVAIGAFKGVTRCLGREHPTDDFVVDEKHMSSGVRPYPGRTRV